MNVNFEKIINLNDKTIWLLESSFFFRMVWLVAVYRVRVNDFIENVFKKNWNHTLLEKVFFLSFGFRSSTEKVSKMLLFQAQIMICSWKKNIFFSNKEHFWFQKTSLAPLRYWTSVCFFSWFCFKSVYFVV
jgi:hypothetical protein